MKQHRTLPRFHMLLFAVFIAGSFPTTLNAGKVTYLILAETVEPIMIVRDGDPMAGGIMTDIVKLIFENSEHTVEPLVLPWQRMKIEFSKRDDWITHGFPESFGSQISYDMSDLPAFPFNHSAVTLKDSGITISGLDDLVGQTLILVENFQYPLLDEFIEMAGNGRTDGSVGVLRAFSPKGTLEMLRHGRGDVVVDWQARIIYNLPAAGLEYEDLKFHDATNIVPTKNIHLIFSKHQPQEIRSLINQRIGQLTESGQLYQLVEEYYRPAHPPDY
jgi:polar amino acid transport system substrate-binding protein